MTEFAKDFQDRLLNILDKVLVKHETLSDAEAVVYFHWARNKNEPKYSFVPEEYR